MNIYNRLTSTLFTAATLCMGVAIPVHGDGLPDPCPPDSHTSADGIIPLAISAFQSCRILGYQAGCTVDLAFGGKECTIDGKKITTTLSPDARELSWKSPDLSIQRVVLKKKLTACSYNYNPMDNGDGRNKAPFGRRVTRATFCADPVQITARELEEAPPFEPADTQEIFDKLENALGSPVVYAVINSVFPGEPPSLIGAPGATVADCDTAVESEDSCFLDPNVPGEFREILEGNSQYVVRKSGSNCAVHCFDIDGIRQCKEICVTQ